MKIRYVFGFASMVYVFAIAGALFDNGFISNVIAAGAAAVMIPLLIVGSNHLVSHYPGNRVYINRWRCFMIVWLIVALIVHVIAAVFVDPASAIAYAVLPTMALLVGAMVIVNREMN